MPSINEQKSEAMQIVIEAAQCAVEPVIGNDEVARIVDQCRLATYWQAGATYQAGDVVMPTTLNGHRYRAMTGGASGATEPVWPLGQAARIRDGAAVWIEDGPDYASAYDVAWAIHLVWVRKAAKSSALYGSGNAHLDQVFDHCRKMAELTKPIEVA